MSADSSSPPAPRITIENRQERVPLEQAELDRWRDLGERALARIDAAGWAKVASPERVGVVVVDDAAIADLHGRFLDDPTPTDVLTFPLGAESEIVLSIETAERQAGEFGNSAAREACLYIVHGLLHLCGYEDGSEEGRAEMAERQERLLREAEQAGPAAP
ncbi:MAG: rRNA maturation RNase YbeY [Akkermansiaceae bacterium]|nr:rRNA maturation RNase YbeY [Akkermansiaceae bacterium]